MLGYKIIIMGAIYIYSRTPLNDHPDIPTSFKSPAQLLLIDISINKFQKYDHPKITAIFFGPMGGRNSEVPLYIVHRYNGVFFIRDDNICI